MVKADQRWARLPRRGPNAQVATECPSEACNSNEMMIKRAHAAASARAPARLPGHAVSQWSKAAMIFYKAFTVRTLCPMMPSEASCRIAQVLQPAPRRRPHWLRRAAAIWRVRDLHEAVSTSQPAHLGHCAAGSASCGRACQNRAESPQTPLPPQTGRTRIQDNDRYVLMRDETAGSCVECSAGVARCDGASVGRARQTGTVK